MKRGEQEIQCVSYKGTPCCIYEWKGLPLVTMANTYVTISFTPILHFSNMIFRKIGFENLSTNHITESLARLCHVVAI